MKIGAVKFHDISFRTPDATGWPFLLACLPREITGCFDGPILQLRGSAAGFHFSSKVNLILSARIVCLFRSVCARARAPVYCGHSGVLTGAQVYVNMARVRM